MLGKHLYLSKPSPKVISVINYRVVIPWGDNDNSRELTNKTGVCGYQFKKVTTYLPCIRNYSILFVCTTIYGTLGTINRMGSLNDLNL